jgi:iron complex outermembrane receptor protein
MKAPALTLLVVGYGFFAPDVLFAAEAAPGEGQLEEVVVTARKREESLQNVPVSVTAIGTEALREQSIETAYDLTAHVAGLVARQTQATRGLVDFTIRGQGSTFGSTPGVITYFGGVPIKNVGTAGANGELFDMESVQVLKGPQGTLFGLSSTGGAVLYDPIKPSKEFGGFVDSQVGNLRDFETTAAVNLPLWEDKLAVRAAFNVQRRAGFTQSLSTGQELDNRHRESYRIGIDFKPLDIVDNYTLFQMNNVNEAATSGVLAYVASSFPLSRTDLTVNPLPASPSPADIGAFFGQKFVTGGDTVQELCAGLAVAGAGFGSIPGCVAARNGRLTALVANMSAELARVQAGGSIRKTVTAAEDSVIGRNQQIINTTTVKAGEIPFLGNVTFKNIFGANRILRSSTVREYGAAGLPQGVIYNNWNLAGEPQQPSLRNDDGKTGFGDDIDEEFQILGDIAGKHNWILGYFTERTKIPFQPPPIFLSFNNAFTVPLDNYTFIFPNTTSSKTHQNGYFGQFTADLSDLLLKGLSLTGGFRLTQDGSTTTTYAVVPGVDGYTAGAFTGITRFSESAKSWTVSLDYHLTPDTLVYAAHRRGFKPGGVNGTAAAAQVPGAEPIYKPETVEDLEIGMKSDWRAGDVIMRTNGAVYSEWLSDAQRSEIVPIGNGGVFTQTGNIAAARVIGFELEDQFIINRQLQIFLNYNWIHAYYTKYPGDTTSLSGAVFPNIETPFIGVPRNQGSIGARYTLPLDEATVGRVSFYAELYAQSPMWLDDTALAVLPDRPGYQKSYDNVNVRADWANFLGSSVDLAVFVRNLFDGEWIVGSNPNATGLGFVTNTWNEPRAYGLEVRYRFGADGNK